MKRIYGLSTIGALVSGLLMVVATPLVSWAQPSDGGQAYLDVLYEVLQENNADAYRIASEVLSDEDHVQLASAFCQGWDAGYSPDTLLTSYLEAVYSSPEASNVSESYLEALAYYAGVAISTSAYRYCPEHWPMMQEWIASQQ